VFVEVEQELELSLLQGNAAYAQCGLAAAVCATTWLDVIERECSSAAGVRSQRACFLVEPQR
jgi:hypothetical protein